MKTAVDNVNEQMNRDLAKSILSKYISIKRNIDILEARIHLNSSTTDEYYKRIYECVGYLTNGWVAEFHDDVKENLSGFNLNVFYDYIELENETDAFLENEIEVEEGALECPRCKSRKTFSYTKQVRSADEGTSVFARCYNCANKWRES